MSENQTFSGLRPSSVESTLSTFTHQHILSDTHRPLLYRRQFCFHVIGQMRQVVYRVRIYCPADRADPHTAISINVVGLNLQAYATRPNGGLGIHWNLHLCVDENYKLLFLGVKPVRARSESEVIFCCF